MTDERPPTAGKARSKPSRTRRVVAGAHSRGISVSSRSKDWVDRQDPASRKGVTIGWYRRFRESDGGLFTVLLAAYFFITAIPAAIVMAGYAYNDPTALADRLAQRLKLTGTVKDLMDSVLSGAGGHQLTATLIAVGDVLIFGMGFGRVLQIAHARSWRIDLGRPQIADQARYFATLLVPLGMILVYILQTKALRGQPSWIGWVLVPVWLFAIFWYFVWMPRMLLHHRVSRRDVVPGAVFTLVGLIGMRLISGLLFKHWLVWYSTYYGSLGIIMALFFWIMIFGGILILAAAFSPALAQRRDLREARARDAVPA